MNAANTIRQVCDDLGISLSELARRTEQFPSTLSRKLSKNNISCDEFQEYLSAVGASAQITIDYPNGKLLDISTVPERVAEKIALLEAQHDLDVKNLEFHKKLAKDIRTEANSMLNIAELLRKRSSDPQTVEQLTEKIVASLMSIESAVAHYLGEGEPVEMGDFPADPELVRGKRMLLVDDNDLNREMGRDVAEEYGLKVEVAENGKEAVDMIRDADPGYYDFILMDVEMPVMDGFEATKLIRALPNRVRASVPIIAVTADSGSDRRQRAIDVGMDGFIVKPISVRRVLHVLTRLI